jgi:AraC-like DNA-binding protein
VTVTQLRFDPLEAILEGENEYQWRTAVQDRIATMDLRQTGPTPGIGSMVPHDLGDLLISDWLSRDVEGMRGSAAVKKDADALLLFTVNSGRQVVQTETETVVQRPGSILMMSTRTTGRFVISETVNKRTVRLPLTALAQYDTGSSGLSDVLCLYTAHNPLARLAHDFISGVDEQVDRMSPAEIESARNALLVLVAGMIRSADAAELGGNDFLPSLRQSLEKWVVAHLSDGAIRVSDLAATHNVALRTVHRAFASTGDTMGSVVRTHRLAAARKDLVNTSASIAAIAHRWGFCDASHLGREFRREFAMSPGDYRAAHGIS